MKGDYKRRVMGIGMVFLAILLMLTFFSNTIHSFNLACVAVDFPTDGIIRNTANGDGVADFMEIQMLYADNSGEIQLFVKDGDIVNAGHKLYAIYSEYEDLEKALNDALESAQNQYNIIVLRIQRIQADISYTQSALDNMEIEPIEKDFASFDYEIERLNAELQAETQALETAKKLYETGAIPKNQLDAAQKELDALISELSQAQVKRQQAVAMAEEAEKELYKAYNEKAASLRKTLSDTEYQLTEYNLEREQIEKSIADLKQQIKSGGEFVVTADNSGKILSAMNMEIRNYVDRNTFIMKLGLTDKNYYSILTFPDSVDYIYEGSILSLDIESNKLYNLQGTVKQVYNEDSFLKALVEFEAYDLKGGERIIAKAEQISEVYGSISPNSAIRYDASQGNYYILYAEKVEGTFGWEYYARRVSINVEMQDSRNTAYFTYLTANGEKLAVITNSDKPISDGDRIRLVDGSDIVETR